MVWAPAAFSPGPVLVTQPSLSQAPQGNPFPAVSKVAASRQLWSAADCMPSPIKASLARGKGDLGPTLHNKELKKTSLAFLG